MLLLRARLRCLTSHTRFQSHPHTDSGSAWRCPWSQQWLLGQRNWPSFRSAQEGHWCSALLQIQWKWRSGQSHGQLFEQSRRLLLWRTLLTLIIPVAEWARISRELNAYVWHTTVKDLRGSAPAQCYVQMTVSPSFRAFLASQRLDRCTCRKIPLFRSARSLGISGQSS